MRTASASIVGLNQNTHDVLHIQPRTDEYANLIAFFAEREEDVPSIRLQVNRFLSAMAWKDRSRYLTLGAMSSGAAPEERDTPRFNCQEQRRSPYGVISRFDFEHLQCPEAPKQQLALALYRDDHNRTDPASRLRCDEGPRRREQR